MVVVAGLVLGFALLLSASQDPQRQRDLRTLAPLLGGRYEDGGLLGDPSIRFKMGRRNASAEFPRMGRGELPCTRVSIDLRGESPGWLSILPETIGREVLQVTGDRDLVIGHPAFDRRFVVTATPESLAALVFRPDQRAEVVALATGLERYMRPTIVLDQEQLTVQVRSIETDPARFLKLVRAARELLRCIVLTPQPEGIFFGEVQIATCGRCEVCGGGMSADIVLCELCRTPHHAECWKYMGRCSTYACRGRRTVA